MKPVGIYDFGSLVGPFGVEQLEADVGELSPELVPVVLKHLTSGTHTWDTMCLSPLDPLGGGVHIDVGTGWSNGRWVWMGYLPYFVERYQIRLPEEFITECVTRVPPIDEFEAAEAMRAVQTGDPGHPHEMSAWTTLPIPSPPFFTRDCDFIEMLEHVLQRKTWESAYARCRFLTSEPRVELTYGTTISRLTSEQFSVLLGAVVARQQIRWPEQSEPIRLLLAAHLFNETKAGM